MIARQCYQRLPGRIRLLRTRTVQYDGPPDHLNDVGFLDFPGERLCGITGTLGRGFKHLDLEKFARIEGVPDGAYRSNRDALLPDVQDGLERMSLGPKLGPAF